VGPIPGPRKGARGSGPREREAYLFAEGRELLWWYIEEIRAQFTDDPDDPQAPLWPSERLPSVVAALNVASVVCPVGPDAFRRALAGAATRHLTGPVQYNTCIRTCSATRARHTTTNRGCRCGTCSSSLDMAGLRRPSGISRPLVVTPNGP
jgi:hypothetical protein